MEESQAHVLKVCCQGHGGTKRKGKERNEKRQQQASIIIIAQSCTKQFGSTESGQCKKHDPPPKFLANDHEGKNNGAMVATLRFADFLFGLHLKAPRPRKSADELVHFWYRLGRVLADSNKQGSVQTPGPALLECKKTRSPSG